MRWIVGAQFEQNRFQDRFKAMCRFVERGRDRKHALRFNRMRLAERVELAGVTRDLLAALGIEGAGLQRPGDFVNVFRGLDDGMRRRGCIEAGFAIRSERTSAT